MRRAIESLNYVGSRVWRAKLKCGHMVEFTAKSSRVPYVADCEACEKAKAEKHCEAIAQAMADK